MLGISYMSDAEVIAKRTEYVVEEGRDFVLQIPVVNTGTSEVSFSDIQTSCSCVQTRQTMPVNIHAESNGILQFESRIPLIADAAFDYSALDGNSGKLHSNRIRVVAISKDSIFIDERLLTKQKLSIINRGEHASIGIDIFVGDNANEKHIKTSPNSRSIITINNITLIRKENGIRHYSATVVLNTGIVKDILETKGYAAFIMDPLLGVDLR